MKFVLVLIVVVVAMGFPAAITATPRIVLPPHSESLLPNVVTPEFHCPL